MRYAAERGRKERQAYMDNDRRASTLQVRIAVMPGVSKGAVSASATSRNNLQHNGIACKPHDHTVLLQGSSDSLHASSAIAAHAVADAGFLLGTFPTLRLFYPRSPVLIHSAHLKPSWPLEGSSQASRSRSRFLQPLYYVSTTAARINADSQLYVPALPLFQSTVTGR